jgi:hypothetical protein
MCNRLIKLVTLLIVEINDLALFTSTRAYADYGMTTSGCSFDEDVSQVLDLNFQFTGNRGRICVYSL